MPPVVNRLFRYWFFFCRFLLEKKDTNCDTLPGFNNIQLRHHQIPEPPKIYKILDLFEHFGPTNMLLIKWNENDSVW